VRWGEVEGSWLTGVPIVGEVAADDRHLEVELLGGVEGSGCPLSCHFLSWSCGSDAEDSKRREGEVDEFDHFECCAMRWLSVLCL